MPESPSSPLAETQLAARIAELRDRRRCPACLAPLGALRCATCGLDLNTPAAHELAAASERAAAALEERAAVLARMRATAAPVIEQTPAVEFAPAVELGPTPRGTPGAASAASGGAVGIETSGVARAVVSTSSTTGASSAGAPRRSSVQVVLVIIGISLLATFAVFGLVYAFINYGVLARSLIVGGVTIAAIVAASLLRRRGLTATGEGIAALGAFLVLLDAWAIRENDFFGLESTDGAAYWGASFLISSILFVGWGRLARLRLPTVAGHVLLVPGTWLLTAGLLDLDDGALTAYLAALVASIAGLLHRILVPGTTARRPGHPAAPERLILVLFALAAVGVASATAPFALADDPAADAAGLIAGLGVALAAALHVAAALAAPAGAIGMRVCAAIAAVAGVLALVVAPLGIALRIDSPELAVSLPLLVAAVLALAGETVAARVTGRVRPVVITAAIASLVPGAVAALAAIVVAAVPTLGIIALTAEPRTAQFTTPVPEADSVIVAALVALTAVIAAMAVTWGARRLLVTRRAVIVAAALPVAVLAAPLAGTFGVTLILWAAIATVGMAVLLTLRGRTEPARIPVAVGTAIATLFGYASSWAGESAWITASIVIVVLLAASRLLTSSSAVRVLPDIAMVGATAVLAAALVDEWLTHGGEAEGAAVALAVGLVGIVTVGVAVIPVVGDPERRALFWTGSALAGLAVLAGIALRLVSVPAPATAVNLGLLPVALAAVWIFWNSVPPTRHDAAERAVAALGMAPVLGAAVIPFAIAVGAEGATHPFLLMTTALLVAIGGLVRAVLGRLGSTRMLGDVGAAMVAVVAIGLASGHGSEPWTALLPAAVLVLIMAVSRDGLVESSSPRKHLSWVAIGLGTVALWTRLADTRVDTIEAYTLPLAGVLLLVAALVHWRAPRRDAARPPAGVPYLVAAALLLALVPSAALVEEETPARTIAVGLGILALIALGLLAGAESSRIGTRADRFICQLVAVAGLAAVLSAVLARGGSGTDVAAIAAVVVLTALHVLIALVPPAFGGTVLSWVAFGIAAAGGLGLIVRGIADPLEWVTAALSAALLLRGALRLRRDAATGSWAQLGAGTAVLLLPSLFGLYVDDPLWRIVGVGVAALAAVVVGVALRLQAPFLIGTVVLIWHLVTQLWTQLRLVYEALPWWLWLGIAGLLVIVIAARYERRLNNLKSIARRIGDLR